MTAVLASIRPDSWNFPLFLHVLGAMLLVGAVTAAVVAQLTTPAVADPDRLRRFSFRTMLFVAIPSWFLMAIGAEWIYSKEFGDAEDDPAWIGIGFITREAGGLLLLIATICAGIASRKSKRGLGKASGIIAAIALAAWIVAVWAMGAKPD
jgi:energy-converting hydrogenase Eha subunit A